MEEMKQRLKGSAFKSFYIHIIHKFLVEFQKIESVSL